MIEGLTAAFVLLCVAIACAPLVLFGLALEDADQRDDNGDLK